MRALRFLMLFCCAATFAGPAAGAAATQQLQPGQVLVIDPDVPPVSNAVLFGVDPLTGSRTILSNFGGTNPTAVAVEADGAVLVTDTDAGTDPTGGASEWGVLYRLRPDPVTGELTRSVLVDFGLGPDTGRNPRAVAVARNGDIFVINGNIPGTRPVLVRVDPVAGTRTIVSDFGNANQGPLGVEPRGIALESGGSILVIDAQAGQGTTGNGLGILFRIDPNTGGRSEVSNFGTGANQGSNPTSIAVDANGQILVTDEGHPSTTPLGLLFRVDPQSGLRSVLSDFNSGANLGREPEGVALEADGEILVIDKHAGPLTHGMLFRVDPQSGARTLVSDFGVGATQGNDPLALAVVPPLPGKLIVVNEVTNDNGGTAAPSNWAIAVTGGNPTPASFFGAGPPGTTVTLAPGPYALSSVVGSSAYNTVLSADCTGSIAAGETRTCTITHDDRPGTLLVFNDVLNDDGGTASPSDWTIQVLGVNPTPSSFAGQGPPGTIVRLDAGAYDTVIARGAPEGYSRFFSLECSGTIDIGELRLCTVTHNDDPPTHGTVTVTVDVVNDDGGTLGPGDFPIDVSGENPVPARFPGEGPPGRTVTLEPGLYSVGVLPPASGYTIASFSPDCAGSIAAGERKTCVITAHDIPTDGVPPALTCDAPDGLWHGSNVSINCTAQDASPLVDPNDAAFSLMTSVPAGVEDPNAATGRRQVCDIGDNCAFAGPIAGNKIDRKAPTLSLPTGMTVDATSPAGAVVNYPVSAADGADPNPAVVCLLAPGSTFSIGTHVVACTATDHVGNAASGSFTLIVLGAKEQLARLVQSVITASNLPRTFQSLLLDRIAPILASFDATNRVQQRIACNALWAFASAVRSWLSFIAPAQTAAWIADADRIRAVLGC